MKQDFSYVCTIGPSMNDYTILKKMYLLGMSTIRFNMSYNHPKMLELINIAQRLKQEYADLELMFDSAGPEIRIEISEPLNFKENDVLVLGKDFDITLNNAYILEKEDIVLIKDGDFVFEVIEKEDNKVYLKAKCDGIIENNNKFYNEKMYCKLPFLSKYDEETIKSAALNNIDSFAISFVRNANNIKDIRETFKKYGKENIKLISKIENREALKNIDEIISESDEIMVARGDLSTTLPRVNIASYQKSICKKCQAANKTVMVATGILQSMQQNDDPRISEILDLYNIIVDGVTKIVFTSETSVASDPIDVLKTANEILASTKKEY